MPNKKQLIIIGVAFVLIATLAFAGISDIQQKRNNCIETTGNEEICNIIYMGSDNSDYCDGVGDSFIEKLCTIIKEKFDIEPPIITLTASPAELWPPNDKPVDVAISGLITDDMSGVDENSLKLVVDNEEKEISIDSAGNFNVIVPLIATRAGQEKEGHIYRIGLTAADNAGNIAVTGATVIVPHDQRK